MFHRFVDHLRSIKTTQLDAVYVVLPSRMREVKVSLVISYSKLEESWWSPWDHTRDNVNFNKISLEPFFGLCIFINQDFFLNNHLGVLERHFFRHEETRNTQNTSIFLCKKQWFSLNSFTPLAKKPKTSRLSALKPPKNRMFSLNFRYSGWAPSSFR